MSIEDHVLLTNATKRPFTETPEMPMGSEYDHEAGLWMLNGSPLVAHDEFDRLQTKKCDQETGEDQKGE